MDVIIVSLVEVVGMGVVAMVDTGVEATITGLEGEGVTTTGGTDLIL